jgi:hypothetical protein
MQSKRLLLLQTFSKLLILSSKKLSRPRRKKRSKRSKRLKKKRSRLKEITSLPPLRMRPRHTLSLPSQLRRTRKLLLNS